MTLAEQNPKEFAKETLAKEISDKYRVSIDQIYIDNDRRENGLRRIRVLSTVSKPGKACCANCDKDGRQLGKTLWISFKRLSNKRFYTLIGHANPQSQS